MVCGESHATMPAPPCAHPAPTLVVLRAPDSGVGRASASAGAGLTGAPRGASAPGMITSTEIRAIVRAELRRFLLHAADSFPPDPSPPSGPPEGLTAALDAWERLSEGQPRGLTVGDARRAGGAAWEALGDALGLGDDDRDVRRVGMALALLAGRQGADGRRLVGGMDRRKVRRWRVAGAGASSVPLNASERAMVTDPRAHTLGAHNAAVERLGRCPAPECIVAEHWCHGEEWVAG